MIVNNALQGLRSTDSYEPCADDYANTYLNSASVKAALNVKKTIQWNSCSNTIKYNSTDSSSVSTAPIYNYLIDGGFGLDILVYSGDDDSVCGTIGESAIAAASSAYLNAVLYCLLIRHASMDLGPWLHRCGLALANLHLQPADGGLRDQVEKREAWLLDHSWSRTRGAYLQA